MSQKEKVIKRIGKFAALALLFVVVAGGTAYFSLNMILRSEKPVVVPDLGGKEVVYALETLTDLGLNTKVTEFAYHADIPKNHIIYQEPEPGEEIRRGRDVRIAVSRGAKQLPAPNVTGLNLYQAEIILQENDLCVGTLSLTHDRSVPKDDIMVQVPRAGAFIERDSCVDLLVSTGKRPQQFRMPSLAGLTLHNATETLRYHGMRPGRVTTLSDLLFPGEGVVGQNPPAGYALSVGTVVDLQVKRENDGETALQADGRSYSYVIHYRAEPGILRRRVRVRVGSMGMENDLFDEFIRPGEDVWLLLPRLENAVAYLYIDDQLEEIRYPQ
jgi:beta-lactam-binding protein with PASTA domain